MTEREFKISRGKALNHAARQRGARLYARLFSTSSLVSFHYFLMQIALRGLGILNYHDTGVSGEEYLVSHLLPRLISMESPVFFDVGANRGDYSLMLARRFPRARIYAFEPHPTNFRLLSRTVAEPIRVFPFALGEHAGSARLYDLAEIDGSTKATLYRGVLRPFGKQRTVARVVNVRTLDQIVGTVGVKSVDFLKIDAEGSELSILRGAQALLKQGRISVIQFEFNEMNVVSKSMLADFRELLSGYSLYRLLPRGLLLMPDTPVLSELYAYQNILAVRAENSELPAGLPAGRPRP